MASKSQTDRDINKFKRDMDKFFSKITSSKQMKKIGKEAIDIVVKRTRADMKGVVKPGGNRKTLKKVTKKYAKQRAKVRNRLRSAARGLNCNLTLRGTMLNNLSVIKATKKKLAIGHTGRKNQLKTINHHATGRQYLFLGKVEIRKLTEIYDKQIGKSAKKV